MMAPLPVSRYLITSDDLMTAARALQIGDNGTQQFTNPLIYTKIMQAEDFVEAFVSHRVGVPLFPVAPPGGILDLKNLTSRNYPSFFIQGLIYWATGLVLQSSYSEGAPNLSEYGKWAIEIGQGFLVSFMDQAAKAVGAGRVRHENPFFPPQLIQPRPPQQS